MEIIPGDLVLVCQKVFGPNHKIEDQWEHPVFRVTQKFGDGPVYRVQKIGDREENFRDLHRNMLFPFLHLVEKEDVVEADRDTAPVHSNNEIAARAKALSEANAFMDAYFDEDILPSTNGPDEWETIQDFRREETVDQ